MKYIFLETDIPTKRSGRIYPKAVVEKAIADIGDTDIFAGIDLIGDAGVINLDNITHKVIEFVISEDGEASATFVSLSTPKGRDLEKIDNIEFIPVGIGIVNKDKDDYIIYEYEILGFEIEIKNG